MNRKTTKSANAKKKYGRYENAPSEIFLGGGVNPDSGYTTRECLSYDLDVLRTLDITEDVFDGDGWDDYESLVTYLGKDLKTEREKQKALRALKEEEENRRVDTDAYIRERAMMLTKQVDEAVADGINASNPRRVMMDKKRKHDWMASTVSGAETCDDDDLLSFAVADEIEVVTFKTQLRHILRSEVGVGVDVDVDVGVGVDVNVDTTLVEDKTHKKACELFSFLLDATSPLKHALRETTDDKIESDKYVRFWDKISAVKYDVASSIPHGSKLNEVCERTSERLIACDRFSRIKSTLLPYLQRCIKRGGYYSSPMDFMSDFYDNGNKDKANNNVENPLSWQCTFERNTLDLRELAMGDRSEYLKGIWEKLSFGDFKACNELGLGLGLGLGVDFESMQMGMLFWNFEVFSISLFYLHFTKLQPMTTTTTTTTTKERGVGKMGKKREEFFRLVQYRVHHNNH